MAWFALSNWWSSSLWRPHQFWRALVEGIKTPWDAKIEGIIRWCITEAWKNWWNIGDSRTSIPCRGWSRGLECSGTQCQLLLCLQSWIPDLPHMRVCPCVYPLTRSPLTEGFPFYWFQFCERLSRWPERCNKHGEKTLTWSPFFSPSHEQIMSIIFSYNSVQVVC